MWSVKLPPDQSEKVRGFLRSKLREERLKNSLWSFSGNGLRVTLYPSGSLVVQGRGAKEWAEKILSLIDPPEGPLAGCDEAGKGEVFGPIVLCCAVVSPERFREVLLLNPKDSKRERDVIGKAKALKDLVEFKFVNITPERFNELYPKYRNLNRLLDNAYWKLIDWAKEKKPIRITVDAYSNKNPFTEVAGIVFKERAEGEVEVAVASLLAKAKFLSELERLKENFGLKLPKGNSREALELARKLVKEEPERARRLLKFSYVLR